MSWSVSDEVAVLRAEHFGLTFPDDLKGVEIGGEAGWGEFWMSGS